ncbi:hypothetical protein [Sphingomonas abietis]|uniref:Uncharacterized protein n=1 Tax=Sphingomonas abietis TaxID=3012344 RepID=A0ABY7NRJ2_9SPHN|nr:hypothetical protein [Sphingomonas abietis]WBO24161.1 hypothetical protein PBT88_08675 [Sphingomonas abietis]
MRVQRAEMALHEAMVASQIVELVEPAFDRHAPAGPQVQEIAAPQLLVGDPQAVQP